MASGVPTRGPSDLVHPDIEILWGIVFLAYVAPQPIRMAAGIVGIGPGVKRPVERVILAYHQVTWVIIGAVTVYVVNHRTRWQWLPERLFGNQNVLPDISHGVGPWMLTHEYHPVAGILDVGSSLPLGIFDARSSHLFRNGG
jgi:hypothetical protein